MQELHGGCACGAAQYKVTSAPLQLVACHCHLCRRMNGAPFSVYAVVRQRHFFVSAGAASSWQATERTSKHFCAACGTPLFNLNPAVYKGLLMVYAGTSDALQRRAPTMNIFCESKLEWVLPNAGSQAFDGVPG